MATTTSLQTIPSPPASFLRVPPSDLPGQSGLLASSAGHRALQQFFRELPAAYRSAHCVALLAHSVSRAWIDPMRKLAGSARVASRLACPTRIASLHSTVAGPLATACRI